MDSQIMAKYIVLLAFFIASVVEAQLTINVEISKEEPVDIGETVTVTCKAKDTNSDGPVTLMKWVKKVGEQETEIGTNDFINNPFKETERYFANLQYDEGTQTVVNQLEIKDVQTTDSGEIGCKIPSHKVDVFKKLTVLSPIKVVQLTSRDLDGSHHMIHAENQTVTFDEGERRNVKCMVNGGYPKPEVKILVGTGDDEKDITSSFVRTDELIKGEGKRGLQELTYNVTMANESLEIDYSMSGNKLRCEGVVPGSELEKESQGIYIELSGYSPKFDCDKRQTARLHQTSVAIECIVRADPPAEHLEFYFYDADTKGNRSIPAKSPEGLYMPKIVSGEADNEDKMILQIDRVYIQHFRKYIFEASNSLGRTTHEITLVQETDEDLSAAHHVTVSILLIAMATLLAFV